MSKEAIEIFSIAIPATEEQRFLTKLAETADGMANHHKEFATELSLTVAQNLFKFTNGELSFHDFVEAQWNVLLPIQVIMTNASQSATTKQ
ncbi:hypothetical protein LFL96_26145 [Paraburkholderia sp. D15]|uniref:hypothetical protein n=1 Tax=Paraburkholderia sp. D15 TaxID=2880218 RepID=UPI00247A2EE8|nr:hypothetical protein [Paraburkholderia sp. D15]WGS54493.1 hypothetical protein LFL96_26145 [Paraburkholderia sp. D15]